MSTTTTRAKPRPRNQQPEMISLNEAASRLDVHYRTVRRWISEGRLSAVRVGPHLLKVDVTELEKLVRPVGGGAR